MGKNVLAIGAHADDIEFGCSGTLMKHIAAGDTVYYLCMTSGISIDGVNKQILREDLDAKFEIRDAAKIIGIDETHVHIRDYPDLHLEFNFDTVNAVESLIRVYNIDTIYTHWAGDANQDHKAVFQITMAAARYVPNVYCYEQIPISRLTENPMNVHMYVDITDYFNTKIDCAEAHKSQIKKYEAHGINVVDNLSIMAMYRGIQAQCQYAEAFQIIKEVR